ncbi:CBS domain-containing protein [Breznakiella homolactica]|uniref:CBS domain-containing protein n=1 Tax=Breznakiella homolactica TaxID=2798577 RepID=A0A7T7XRB7_9SPIR|nr:CBS domain-containing protein [Breznakiella homolactica]QQO11067.1 CBS domain-containing protein [Breznakiella homolactica]
MDIAFGHTNMDLDCLGSLILVKKLYPGYRLVKSRLIHPAARNLYNMYQDFFDFMNPKEIEEESIENVIIVDTCTADRVKEYFSHIRNPDPSILIFDHHPTENCDILGARLEGKPFGANTSFLGKMAMDRGIPLAPEEATIALTGIYADTGRLIYENVCREDYEVAAYLLDMGASLKLVKSFLETIKEEEQIAVLHGLLRTVTRTDIQGHSILLSYMELEENIPGLAAIVEKIMDIEDPDAYFAVFCIAKTKTILLIARSQKIRIDLHELLSVYGGGGHQMAGSAKIENQEGPVFYDDFCSYLEQSLTPATRARDIMTREFRTIREEMTLMEASRFLEEADLTGVPVLNGQGELKGFLSLRDIMKGRKAEQMHSPVKAYMTRKVIASDGSISIREVERIFYRNHIGHLPIVEDNKLVGIVTRWDYLEFKKRQNSRERALKNDNSPEVTASGRG